MVLVRVVEKVSTRSRKKKQETPQTRATSAFTNQSKLVTSGHLEKVSRKCQVSCDQST